MIVAHPGQPLAPHDLWAARNAAPVLALGFLLVAWAYGRGRQRAVSIWRARCFAAALVVLGVALLSPLDALSSALASAHMVQHLLLILVAAPLIALSAPSSAVLRGSPFAVRRAVGWSRRRLRSALLMSRALRHPATAWLLHVATLWFWHAAVAYDAALEYPLIHNVEHATLLFSAVLFWNAVIGTRSAGRATPGVGVLLVFTMALQSTFLALLLTFARTPWYASYATTTRLWHLEPLADQQLAGVIMWVPAGMIYPAVALALVVAWIRGSELDEARPEALPRVADVDG